MTEAAPFAPEVQFYRDQIAARVAGRPIILCLGVVAAMKGLVDDLAQMGAGPFCLLAYAEGAGALPDPAQAEWHVVCDLPAGLTISEELNHYNRALCSLPPAVVAAVEAFDPHKRAVVLPGFATDFDHIAGRPNVGRRQPAWIALEDKTVIDALWDDLGVPRVESAVVPVDAAPAAHRALDVGLGTVWAADARDGFNGGAAGTRWIRDAALFDEALAFFGPRADSVRVMPFLEGIPCSIHGMVLGDDIIALRPCEMVVMRQVGDSRFRYAGASTFWDPPAADRAEMRRTARVVAAGLKARHGYRGMFTVDGVMTAEGFRPTELNPRFGAASQLQAGSLTGLPLLLLDLFARGGADFDWRAAALESMIVEAADAHRRGGGWTAAGGRRSDSITHAIVWTGEAYRIAKEGETADGSLMVGPTAHGTFSRFSAAADRTPIGPSIAPRTIEAFRLAETLGAEIGPLEPAQDVRPASRSEVERGGLG